MFSTSVFIIKRNTGGPWCRPGPVLLKKIFRTARYILKSNYPQTCFTRTRYMMIFRSYIYVYIDMISEISDKLFSTPSLFNLIDFRYPSITKHVILLTFFFSHFRLGANPLYHAVVANPSHCLSCSSARWFFV